MTGWVAQAGSCREYSSATAPPGPPRLEPARLSVRRAYREVGIPARASVTDGHEVQTSQIAVTEIVGR